MSAYSDFLENYPTVTYRKGEIIISQGEIPTRAYAVKSGLVKKYDLSHDGSERLIDISVPGDLFPDDYVFGKLPSAYYFHEAMGETVVYSIPPREMREFIDTSHEVQRMFMDRYLGTYVAQTLRISALTYSVATEKLLHTLRYLCVRFGGERKDDRIELNIYLTHQQLAELLGLSRETTTNELIKLKKRGVITYDRKRITVFVSQLSEAIGSLDADELTLGS